MAKKSNPNLFYEREELAKKFIRVGDDYMKEVFIPDKDGRLFRMYVKRDKGTVQDDLGGKNSDFYKSIRKYEGFCIVPSHTEYKQVIEGFFNEYYQISHEPKKGECKTILGFLTHIFGVPYLNFILDYIQLMYLKPTQRLPILLLESKERGTGKSTFGNLLKLIFEDNSVKIGNSELDSDFNSIWVKKLAIIVDETSLEKASIMQMLKRYSTETGKVTANEKNKAQKQVDFFGKFIFLSNEEGKSLPIEKGENRFAVFKIKTFKENNIQEDPQIEDKIRKEIPAFLYYLKNRKLHHHEESRMYFALDWYYTEQLQLYYDNSLSATAKVLRDYLIEAFSYFDDETELKYSLSNLMKELDGRYRYLERSRLQKAIQEEFGVYQNKKNRYPFHSLKEAENSTIDVLYSAKNENNYYYTFKRSQFITE
jgi:hypothetical protein